MLLRNAKRFYDFNSVRAMLRSMGDAQVAISNSEATVDVRVSETIGERRTDNGGRLWIRRSN